ncbi:MAG TPA: cupredoxin family copper-binding protein [Candidatus Nanoarchaeia archaeon]|nr:cupredoxin family copper-binding protein [Candidatus Nanoarchaeia archaeon]
MKKIVMLMFLLLVACAQPQVVPQPEPLPVVEAAPVVESSGLTTNVQIRDFHFQPQSVNIKVGDTVVWTQQDSVQHTVTIVSGPESFDSGLLSQGQTFRYTFTKPGTYSYKCTPHPGMTGRIFVE